MNSLKLEVLCVVISTFGVAKVNGWFSCDGLAENDECFTDTGLPGTCKKSWPFCTTCALFCNPTEYFDSCPESSLANLDDEFEFSDSFPNNEAQLGDKIKVNCKAGFNAEIEYKCTKFGFIFLSVECKSIK